MSENQQPLDLNSRVRSVWQRSQKLHLSSGFLAFFRWAILLFALGVLFDWLIDLPAAFRVGWLVLILSVSLYRAWRGGWRNLRRFDAVQSALQMEDHQGGMESLLVTAIEFQQSKSNPGTSQSLLDITCHRAEEAVISVLPENVVRYRALRRPMTVALGLILLIVIFGVLNGPFLSAGIARIFPPWMAVAYPTRTQLEVSSEKMIVKEGSSAVISARVSGVVPNKAKLELRTGNGEPRTHVLEIEDQQCEYTIEAAYRGFEYRITAGDAKTPWQVVEVISSPRIKQAKVALEYPAYTQRPIETVEALTITVPEGTEVHWKLTLDRAVREASYVSGTGEDRPLEISDDGLTVSMRAPATESRAYRFFWVEKEHAFAFAGSNHYLQVTPDEPPRVELSSPKNHLYATLGRKVDLAFRGRDDHGIGEAVVAFRVNKIEEQRVGFSAKDYGDGGEQKIDWDYRTALPDLAVGDTVSFVVELADLYPGDEGAHRVRSQARRITFLSEKDYLTQIDKRKQRLLLKLRAIYREERRVHATVGQLDPSAGEFVQSCQLEAVRQDLMADRIVALKQEIQEILDDLAANQITDDSITALLVRLQSDLVMIAKNHVGLAASKFRELGGAVRKGLVSDLPSTAEAVKLVDSAARELACLVLQIGFKEATEVMARELHAVSESQAPIRMETILLSEASDSGAESLALSQDKLSQWVSRLFGAVPKDKESTVEDALIAFNLSRLVKGLRLAGVESKMLDAAALIRKSANGGASEAAKLQAEIVKALLHAEFRLRVGAEYEALDKAGDLFAMQVIGQQALRDKVIGLTPAQFEKERQELYQAQIALQKQLYLLLMPAVQAPRPKLFDVTLPAAPPVSERLAAAENAIKKAAALIQAGEREKAIESQRMSEEAFIVLGEIINERIEALTEREMYFNLGMELGKYATEITAFEERQLILIEKTEDLDDENEALGLARIQEKLVRDIERFRLGVVKLRSGNQSSSGRLEPFIDDLGQLENVMNRSLVRLKEKKIDDAIEHQENALTIFEEITKVITGELASNSFLATSLNDTWTANRPAPYVGEIQAEQLELVTATAKAKIDELPHLAIVQKNLIHAVNAVLGALDPLSHQIESGTVFLFAKDDMDAAATAIEEKDREEAADAGSFVAESLGDLSRELAMVTPRYGYLLEINEFYHQAIAEVRVIQAEQKKLRFQTIAPNAPAELLREKQLTLQVRAKSYGSRMLRGTGLKRYSASAEVMDDALGALRAGRPIAAARHMQRVESILGVEAEQMTSLMELIANVLKPSPTPDVSPDSALVLDVLSVASDQKVLYWKTQAGEVLPSEQVKLAKRSGLLVQRIEAHARDQLANPTLAEAAAEAEKFQQFFATNRAHMVQANTLIAEAVEKLQSGDDPEAVRRQKEAGDFLRYVLIAYISEFLSPPGPPSSSDPVVTDPTESSLEDSLTMFMPGAVSGGKPKGGRQEWEVLGKRDRAALNENFARELPLEYRTILKDYYERLAK